MHRRLNITLPEETVQMMDRIAKTGGRSRLIDEAVREFVQRRQKASLKKQLKEGAGNARAMTLPPPKNGPCLKTM